MKPDIVSDSAEASSTEQTWSRRVVSERYTRLLASKTQTRRQSNRETTEIDTGQEDGCTSGGSSESLDTQVGFRVFGFVGAHSEFFQ